MERLSLWHALMLTIMAATQTFPVQAQDDFLSNEAWLGVGCGGKFDDVSLSLHPLS